MGLFSRKPAIDTRLLGEMLAVRLTLTTVLSELSGDFGAAIGDELAAARSAALLLAKEREYPQAVSDGIEDFMRSFIAAARRHA